MIVSRTPVYLQIIFLKNYQAHGVTFLILDRQPMMIIIFAGIKKN